MKKLFVLFLAALVAGLTQAVQVDWSSGDLKDILPGDATSVTAYYIVLDCSAEELARLKSLDSEHLYNEYCDVLDSVPQDQQVTMNGLGSASWELDDDNISPPVYVVAIYKADSVWGGSYALATVAEYAETENGIEDTERSSNGDIAATAYAGNSGSWVAVPEPTTVALLALGLAAIGLKRKVA